MKKLVLLLPLLFTLGCATQYPRTGVISKGGTQNVRTTAYTQTEPGGSRDAVGRWLTCRGTVHSAAADWSRFPLGTKFQILSTGEICQITDYGSALVGTNTIDLFKDSRAGMRQWGVRMVDIRIIEWGSPSRSLEVLLPRQRNAHVQRMVVALHRQVPQLPTHMRRVEG